MFQPRSELSTDLNILLGGFRNILIETPDWKSLAVWLTEEQEKKVACISFSVSSVVYTQSTRRSENEEFSSLQLPALWYCFAFSACTHRSSV